MTASKSSDDRVPRPYGEWPSPVSPRDLAAAAIQWSLPRVDGSDVLWIERRPAEGARSVIVRRSADGSLADLIGPPFSARSRVHEYGGGDYAAAGGRVVFVNDADQDLYLAGAGAPDRLTHAPDLRFADMAFDPASDRILTVVERHPDHDGPQNMLAAIPLTGARRGEVLTILAGRDFYASPRPSPDGSRLAWLAWDLPHMPWQAAELWVAAIRPDGGVEGAARIAGGGGDGAFQPEWAGDGALYFVTGRDGWDNLHVWRTGEISVVVEVDAEFSRPLWSLATTAYAVVEPGRLIATCWSSGEIELGIADERARTWSPIGTGFTRIDAIAAGPGGIALAAGDDTAPAQVHIASGPQLDFAAGRDRTAPLAPADVSRPRSLVAPVDDGEVHALYFAPASAAHVGEAGTLPPMVVSAHGGPTGMARRGFELARQFWTTRGFAFLEVDYRGSTGYGRQYREALDGRWGELDADDAVAAARFAASQGLADPARLVIRGSSAGGLTVLNALIRSDLFAAGASLYGVTDLVRLAADTHKFEAGYLDSLIGGPPADLPDVYRARSPVHNAEHITAPVIFFQGLDDAVVPPSQSRAMARSLDARGIPVAILEFEGEGHGFRHEETIAAALAAELAFYTRILGLTPVGPLPDLEIRNFGAPR